MATQKQIEAADESLVRYGFELPWLAIAAVLEAAEAAAWETIETAPEGGTTLFVKTKEGLIMGWRDQHDHRWLTAEGYAHIEPTHWRPLPPPPKADD